ncbi:MAG: isoprenylcysteine carboxylmethyltransferase family protein [Bacillota bacterium]|jgi:protein-S-isoprenylcysteine O-methyltransferase Ste14|nr:isoprenylcysteine carboxylmethyltransferase family protein [Bacillota bacterium]NLV63562.1 isoprenylcysteine carboxylmethyltransferase family protein [Clostridiaceae bacterium]
MDKKLFIQAIVKYVSGLILVSILLFIPAGTLNYWNAWMFIGALCVPMLIVGIVLMIRNPELLRKRLNAKEKEAEQKSVILFGGLMFVIGFVVAGLDYRFQWLVLPEWLVIAATVVLLFAYLLYAEVLRENAYLSRTIEVQEGQKVIDSGLYGIVRHPMYVSTILLFLSMPLVLGSFFSFLVFLIYPVITVKRIRNEEEVLEKSLEGYSEYKKRVKYRLIPFIW